MLDSTTEALTPKVTPLGLLLALIGGVVAAGAMGFAYHLIANKAEIDYIIVFAIILGAVVGFVTGTAGRLGGLRAALPVMLIGFVCGVGAYVARYAFEYNDAIETAVQEVMQDPDLSGGLTVNEVRSFIVEGLATEYPPGGLVGYMNFVAESGFSISRGSSSSDSGGADLQGGMAWGLLGIEALAAGIVAAGAARSQLKPKAFIVSSTTSAPPPMSDPTTSSQPPLE